MTTRKARKDLDHRTRVGRERSARTQTRILEAALGVFGDMGPDAPKIDDFVRASGISRGTFYNYFETVGELLDATSEWTTREIIESIEAALEGIAGPALRLGVGLRLFFRKAQADPVWCRFVARVWKLGGFELPARDLEEGLRAGVFRAPSVAAARDVLFGGVREALLRIGSGRTPAAYGAQLTEVLLQALATDGRRIAAVMNHDLPPLRSESDEGEESKP
jgi:AcrR family transcriptional regulator